MKQLRAGLSCFIVLFVLVAGVYPMLVTLVSQLFFTEQANGSLVHKNNVVIGSKLIGQQFNQAKYFQGRPSAGDYDGGSSGGYNLSPQGEEFARQVEQRQNALKQANLMQSASVPDLLLTASGSGLDPEITPQAALWQVPRIAIERQVSEQIIRNLIQQLTQSPLIPFAGEQRVNVLMLNLALDKGV